jgi:hypothetical protein
VSQRKAPGDAGRATIRDVAERAGVPTPELHVLVHPSRIDLSSHHLFAAARSRAELRWLVVLDFTIVGL